MAVGEETGRIIRSAQDLWRSPDDRVDSVRAQLSADLAALEKAKKALVAALGSRHIPSGWLQGSSQFPGHHRDWITQAESLAREARERRVPFLKANQLEDQREFSNRGKEVLGAYDMIRDRLTSTADGEIAALAEAAFRSWLDSFDRAATAIRDETVGRLRDVTATEPTSINPAWGTPRRQPGQAPRPEVHVGRVALTSWNFTLGYTAADAAATRHSSPRRMDVLGEALSAPVALDLDDTGGFITPHAELVQRTVLQLLQELPPGMLRIDAVDPVGLGESASFLFGLNDAGPKVLGDAIWTTASQTAQLLESTEKHVTFVTQKYLQGQHETLTEYNVAAGEVAEPYRVTLLYDFPAMFTRDKKSWDEESLHRLAKLTSAGRRAGVYFLVVAHDASGHGAIDALPMLNADSIFGAPTTFPDADLVTGIRMNWEFVPASAPDEAGRESVVSLVLRDLETGPSVRVDPDRVAELSTRRRVENNRRGLAGPSGSADPSNPETWWTGDSTRHIASRFGRMGAADVATIELNSEMESSALVGGRTGSGKSTLLHSLLLDFALNYSPDELELYLVDLKEGVEFKDYADLELPHARVVAIESNREFALAVLRVIDAEITRRGVEFKRAGSGVVSLPAFRETTGEAMPRVLVVIDEFHKMLATDDATSREAQGLLERVIKEGRAFGVHSILGSQTIASVGAAFRSLADQIQYRLVLPSSEADSRLLLGENNPDAALLSEAGEGIVNARGGIREANNRFQATFWDAIRRSEVLKSLRERADQQGSGRRAAVFDGASAVPLNRIPVEHRGRSDRSRLRIPVGVPMTLEPVLDAEFDRAPGRNLLIVDEGGLDTLAIACADLLSAGVPVTLIDFGAFPPEREDVRDALHELGAQVVHARSAPAALSAVVADIDARIGSKDYSAEPRAILIGGLQRARELSPDDYGTGADGLTLSLRRIVTDGPEVGIHVIAWAETAAAVERRLSASTLREFGLKLIGRMNGETSRQLIDTPNAESLHPESEYLFDDFDKAVTRLVRRLSLPGVALLAPARAAADG